MEHLVIIGNGIAGITCARNVRKKSDIPITIIGSETQHFYARTALMYIYMGHMKYEHTKPYEDQFWADNKLTLVHNTVIKIDTNKKEVALADKTRIQYSQLVIATGSVSNLPDLPGVNVKGVHTLYNMQDLEAIDAATRNISHAVIAGGGLIGIELAEMLRTRNIDVTILVREGAYWGSVLPKEEAEMIGRHLAEHHIKLRLETEIQEVKAENGNVKGVSTKDGELIPCQFLGLTIGVRPNISLLMDSDIKTDKGILVDKYFMTSIPDVYAIGDCAQYTEEIAGRKPIEQVWYTGRMHGQTLAQTLCGNKTAYQPGPWFNSAKFLDIEYQTYGHVPVKPEEGNSFFYWQHNKDKAALRIHFESESGKLLGVNSMGMRLRHDVLQYWLSTGATAKEVVAKLADAIFDPEFSKKYEREIAGYYNKMYNTSIKPEKKSWKRLLHILQA